MVIADLDAEKAQAAAAEIGGPDVAVGIAADVTDEDAVQAAIDATLLAFGGIDLVVNNAGLSLSKALLETTVKDWDLQHNVMAKGSFLVSRAAAKALIEQQLGGDIVYISSQELDLRRPQQHRVLGHQGRSGPPGTVARRRAGGARRHRSTASTPTVWSAGPASSPAAGAPSAPRCTALPRRTSAQYYAQRTLLKREVLPDHVADAVFALTGGELSRTTGLHIPVDSGVAAAFLR